MGGDSILSSVSNEDGSVHWNSTMPVTWNNKPCTDSCDYPSGWMILGSNNELYINGVTLQDGVCSLRVFDFQGNSLRKLPCLEGSPRYSNEEDAFVTTLGYGNVSVHSGTDGHLLWNVNVPDATDFFPPRLQRSADFGRDGTVFVRDHTYEHMYALGNGKVAWILQTGGGEPPVMSEDGTTYVQGLHNQGHGIETFEIVAVGADGEEKWRYTTTEAVAELV